jgi:hypothetical protein
MLLIASPVTLLVVLTIGLGPKELVRVVRNQTELSQDVVRYLDLVNTVNSPSVLVIGGKFTDQIYDYQLLHHEINSLCFLAYFPYFKVTKGGL